MTDDQHAYWLAYLRYLADQIGLKDWEIDLKRDHPDDANAAASMRAVVGRRKVCIRLGDGFYADTPENQRHYALHELLHVHLDDIDTAVWQASDIIGGDTFRLMEKVIKDRVEFAVDNIAAAIGPAYPLPPERIEL